MSTLEKAIQIAVQAHTGQTDKAGAPYILHPLRLMFQMRSETEQITAVLHDVVEDSDWSLDALRAEGFSEEIISAIDSLTRRQGQSYTAFIARIKENSLARRVKLADIEDNMNMTRISIFTETDANRLEKYHRAWKSLRNQ